MGGRGVGPKFMDLSSISGFFMDLSVYCVLGGCKCSVKDSHPKHASTHKEECF